MARREESGYSIQEVRKAEGEIAELVALLANKMVVAEVKWSVVQRMLKDAVLRAALARWSGSKTCIVTGFCYDTLKAWKREVEWRSS